MQAGGCLILNNANFHCVTQRYTKLRRRAVHVRYRRSEPVVSRHGILDPWQSVAEYAAALPDRAALRPPLLDENDEPIRVVASKL